jgi:hypothetical protein
MQCTDIETRLYDLGMRGSEGTLVKFEIIHINTGRDRTCWWKKNITHCYSRAQVPYHNVNSIRWVLLPYTEYNL